MASALLTEAICYVSVEKKKKFEPLSNVHQKCNRTLESHNFGTKDVALFVFGSLWATSPIYHSRAHFPVAVIKFRAFTCPPPLTYSPSLEMQIGRPELGRSLPIG